MRKCHWCDKHINIGDWLECSKCGGHYHYFCANIEKSTFLSKRDELERTWACPACQMITKRKNRNDNTPIRSQTQNQQHVNDTVTSFEESFMGDTQQQKFTPQNKKPIEMNEIDFMEKISTLLDSKLNTKFEQLRISIIKDITQEFNNKIEKLKSEFVQTTDFLTLQQNELKSQMNEAINRVCDIEFQIKNLHQKHNICVDENITKPQANLHVENENLSLQNKIEELYYKINEEKYCKKIILYGLNEYKNETEQNLIEQLNNLFYDTLDIELNGYIEKVKRLGRNTYKRPVEIELISKRITEYILSNSIWFKNTGIYISKYLTKEQQQERQTLMKLLKTARENKQYAVIRDNKLYVDGQLYTDTQVNTNMNITSSDRTKHPHTSTTDQRINQQHQQTSNKSSKPFRE